MKRSNQHRGLADLLQHRGYRLLTTDFYPRTLQTGTIPQSNYIITHIVSSGH